MGVGSLLKCPGECHCQDDMKSNTVAILNELEHFPWFTHVGECMSDDVGKAEDWKQAEALCQTTVWASIELQVGNCLSYRVNRTNYDRFLQWNPTALQINDRIDQAISSQLKEVTARFGLGKRVAECIESDITLSCLEAEFSDVWPPIFFLNQVLP
jgi:hypothetical protein